MSIRSIVLALPLVAVVPLLAACSGDEPEATASQSASNVEIVATEYAFSPENVTVPAGEVTFTVRNDGQEEHEFEIFQGDRVIDEVEGLIPGLERDLTVTLDPGEYRIVCMLNDHLERGMEATLTVTA
jgi:iron uptake system EfeUOB component EfeO/EfeM